MSWRGTLHTLPTGAARAVNGMGRAPFFFLSSPSPYSCVCTAIVVQNSMHVRSRVRGRVIKESPPERTTQPSSVMSADKESTAHTCLPDFRLEPGGRHGELVSKCHIAGAAASLLGGSLFWALNNQC